MSYGGEVEALEELIDPGEEFNGFSLGDEVGFAGGGVFYKGVEGEGVGVGGVFDVGDVDEVVAIADDFELIVFCAF